MPKPPERGKQAATSKKDDKGKKVDTTSKKHHRSSNSPPQDSSSSKRRPQGRAAESQRHRATRDQEDPGMPSRHNDGSGVETYPNTDFQGPGSGYGPQSFQPPPPSHRPPQQQQQYVQLLQQQLWAPPQQQQQYVPDPLPEQYPQQQQDLEVDFSDLLEQQLWDPELKQPPQQQQQYAQDPQPERYQQSYPHLPPQSVAGQSGHHPSLTDQVHGQTHGYWQPPTLGTPAQPQAFGYGTGQSSLHAGSQAVTSGPMGSWPANPAFPVSSLPDEADSEGEKHSQEKRHMICGNEDCIRHFVHFPSRSRRDWNVHVWTYKKSLSEPGEKSRCKTSDGPEFFYQCVYVDENDPYRNCSEMTVHENPLTKQSLQGHLVKFHRIERQDWIKFFVPHTEKCCKDLRRQNDQGR